MLPRLWEMAVNRLSGHLLAGLALLLAAPGTAAARPVERVVYVGEINGVINPLTVSYLDRVISTGERANAAAVLIRLDTPGGLASAMSDMTERMMNSRVPLIVYVSPRGARAASAGMFITIAANIAAMAPATTIGASTPITLGGKSEDEVTRYKVVQAYASQARAIAEERGRNSKWAEGAVRYAYSATAEEALRQKVIDLIAYSSSELLDKIDGRRVTTADGPTALHTRDARTEELPMGFLEQVLHVVTDPNVAYLLLLLGLIGIVMEFYHPGGIVPGAVGVISLALCFVAMGALPISWAGVALICIAVGLMIAELHVPGISGFGIASVAAFVVGSVLLFSPLGPVSPVLPAARVSPWLIGGATVVFASFFLLVIGKVVQTRRRPVVTGIEALVGKRGTVTRALQPRGTVILGHESWSAESVGDIIPKGVEVEVVGVNGVILRVGRAQTSSAEPDSS
jgi:membrane-bound serine protease (ClpP class)